MKRVIPLLLCVAILAGFIVMPVGAVGDAQFTIVADKTTVAPGDQVTYTVTLSAAQACTQYGLQLSYDTDVFEMVGGECTATGAFMANFSGDGFLVMYMMETVPGASVGTFTLKVREDATEGSTAVTGSGSGKNLTEQIPFTVNTVEMTVQIPEETQPEGTQPEVTEPTEPEITEPTLPQKAEFHIAADREAAAPGDTVTYTVTLSTQAACTQYGLQLSYDTDVFEVTDGKCTVTGAMLATFSADKGFAVLYTTASVPGTEVGTFTLKVKDDAAAGSTTVTGSPSMVNGSTAMECTINSVNMEITETEPTEPEVTEPEVTEPEVTEPEVTEPTPPQKAVFHIAADKATAAPGNKVTYTVTLSAEAACTQYGLQLSYDADIFEVADGKCTATGAVLANFSADKGFAVLYMPASVPGTQVGTFTLQVKEDAMAGSTTVTGIPSMINSSTAMECTVNSVSLEITEPEPTEPEVTEPEETEPEATEPTEPEVTEPVEPQKIVFHVSADKETVTWGDEVTYTVTLSTEAACTQYGLQLIYDADVFEIVSGQCNATGAMLANFSADKGFAVLYVSAAVPGSTVGSFTLRVKDAAPYGSTTVTANSSVKNGALTIESSVNSVDMTISPPQYTVEFLDWDGTVLSSKTYFAGDPVEAPTAPIRVADNIYTYTFAGWDKDVVACAGDTTYIATYEGTYIDYTVTFKNWDGTVLSTAAYHYGDPVEAPSAPVKAADRTFIYTFAGWDKEVAACTGNATYTATYEATYIDYTVTFKNWDGSVLSTVTCHYGDPVEVPAEPAKAADSIYTYTFAGWDKEVVACAGNTTYTATYEAIYIDYTVSFVNWDGSVLARVTCHWGETVSAPAEPAKAADNTYTYAFAGWDKEIVACAGDTTYTATYSAQYIDYTVTFRLDDGTVLHTATYHWGDAVAVPADPDSPSGYRFDSWDKEVTACQGDAIYTAVFTLDYPVGDYTQDMEVSNEDVVYLLWHTLFPEDYPVTSRADFDNDGEISNEDVVYLLWHTLFPEDYPLVSKEDE